MRKFVHISDPSSRCSECSPSRGGLHRRNRGLAASAAWLAAAVLMGSGSKALWAQEPRVVERPLQQSANISVATGMENPGVLRTELRLVPSASSVTLDRLQVAEDRDSSSRSKQTGDPVNSSQSSGTSRLPKPTDFQERLNPWELGWTKPVAKVGVFEAPDRALVGLWVSAGDVVDAIVPIFATVGRDGTLSEERPGERLGGYGGSAKRVVREGSVVAGFELERGPYFGRSEVVRLRVLWKKLTPDGVNPNVSEESEFFGTGNYAQIQERRWILAEPGSWISGLGALASWHTSGEIFLNDITFLQETPSGSIAWNGGAERGKPSEPVLPEPQPQPTPELPKADELINGDFEESRRAADDSAFVTLYRGDESTGWRVEYGQVDHIGGFWSAGSGKRSLDMNGLVPGTISQTFATEPGKDYRVTFKLSANPDGGPRVRRLIVTTGELNAAEGGPTDGQIYEFDTVKEGSIIHWEKSLFSFNELVKGGHMHWETRLFSFKARDSKTKLIFSSMTLGPYGPALDAVRLLAEDDVSVGASGPDYAMFQTVVDSAGGARLMRTPQFISAWESRWSEAGMAGVGGGESNPLLVDLTSGNPDEDTLPLPVILPPVIEQQPLSAKVLANGWVNLRVQASGSSETDGSELTYQWLKDGVVLEGATGSELRRRASESAAGVYTVVVTNEGGSVTSEGANVQVLPAAQLKGVYQGLVLEGAEASIPEADANAEGSALAVGRVTLTLTGQTAFSGRLDYAGVTYRFKGELDEDWTFEKTLSAKGKPPVDLTVALSDSGEGLWVSVQGGQLGEEAKAQANLQRFAFDPSKSAVAVGSRYTGGLAPQDQETACWGYLTGSLAKTGIVSVSGKSADGAAVVGSAYVQTDGTLALYSELFGALHPYPGQLCGSMSLVDAAGTGRVGGIFTEINFAKPQPRELVTEAESMQTVVLTGSSYQAPSGKQSVLELDAANPLLDLWVIENEGEESFSQIRLAEGNKFEELDPKPLRFRVRLDAATGVVYGKYSDPESGLSWKAFGVVLQADKKVFGFWYGNGQSGSWHLTAPAEESTVPEALP